MKRRTLLKSIATLVAVRPLSQLEVFAQAAVLNDTQITTLHAIADVVLPASLGADGRDQAVQRFAEWVANFREGAERGGGYGNAQLGAPVGASPAARYPAQFAALDDAARAQGSASFAALPVAARRALIETKLEGVNNLPARPNGANLVADFMGLYFNGPDATDLAYEAAIGRDVCRGLEGSEKAPK